MAIELPLLPPEDAIAYLEDKGYAISFDWRDVLAEEHVAAFTVAKMMRVDLLEATKQALIKAEREGWDLRRFSQELRPTLEREGWWGRKEMADPDTAEIKTVQLGSPRRLEIIYDTNIRAANGAGEWMRGERGAKRLPMLLYRTMGDMRVRPAHARWNGVCLPRTDAWWDTHYPPNGWRCRCKAFPISEADVRRLKDSGRIEIKPAAPPTETLQWVNPRTGEVRQVPVGIDPGWDYNVGKSRQAHLDKLLADKEAAFVQGGNVRPPMASIERRVLDLGAKSADFGGRPDIAGAVAADLEDLAQRGVAPPDHVRVSGPAFEAWAKQTGQNPADLIAAFASRRQTGETYLVANPLSAYWADRATFAATEQARGYWSSADPAHGVRHEMGHLSQHRQAPEIYAANAPLSAADRIIALRVSAYAGDDGREFVAETFAALLAGREFDEEVMQLYRQLGGFEPI
jgi:SPP1 gp7 family putative phage head morphogenesis protein